MVIAVSCGDQPVQLEIPLAGYVRQAVNVLDAKICWEEAFGKGLDLSACEQLPIDDKVLRLELPANSGKLIRLMQ